MPAPPLPTVSLPRSWIRPALACAAVVALLGLGWLWLRDSPLVAVEQVTVTGATGPDAARVRLALEGAARDMTTLHVRADALRAAVAPYGRVASVRASPDFPHRLRIEVREHTAVAAMGTGSERVGIAADGTVLRGVATARLPVIGGAGVPAAGRITDAALSREVALLASAPAALRARVVRVSRGPRGLTLPLRNGPTLFFGGGERLRAKWIAAAAVLGDPTSAGATYLDVRLPERPAAGGLAAAASSTAMTGP